MPNVVNGKNPYQQKMKGWGADLDTKNRPGVPHQVNNETVLTASSLTIRDRQPETVKIFKTKERRTVTPVFGTTAPPFGVSGLLRTFAFRFSEDKLRHWMLLLFADRVNMVEGWFQDIASGRLPMLLPRMEFRTLDHLNRVLQQGPKNKSDRALLLTAGLAVLGLSAAGYYLGKRTVRMRWGR